MRLQHCIRLKDDVPIVCGRIGQLVGNALRSSVVDILRIVIRRRCNRHPSIQVHPLCADLHLCLFDIPLDIPLVCRLLAAHKPLDRLSAIVGLRRLCDSAVVNHGIRVNLERRDLAESIQTTVRIGRNFIISCVRTVQLDIRIVDPVVPGLPSDYSRSSAALDVRTLEQCAVARLERDHIAGDDTARCSDIKANCPRWNIIRTVVDLRHLFERTRNILRLDLALRRNDVLQSDLSVRRMCRCTVFVCKCIVLPDIAANRDVVGDGLVDDTVGGIARDILVRIAALNRHNSTIIYLSTVRLAYELVLVVCARHIADVCVRIRLREHIVMQFFIVDRTIDEVWITVINLVNPRSLRQPNVDCTPLNMPLTCNGCLAAVESLPVQRVVLEQFLIAGICARRHMVGCLYCIHIGLCRRSLVRRMGGLVPVLVDKVCAVLRKSKFDPVRIAIKKPRPRSCARTDLPVLIHCKVARPVVGLRCRDGMSIRILYTELVRIKCLRCDRSLAIGIGSNRIVARRRQAILILECRVHIRIADIVPLGGGTRILILERCIALMPVVAHCVAMVTQSTPSRAEIVLRNPVAPEDIANHRTGRLIRNRLDRAGRIDRRIVRSGIRRTGIIDLRHGCHRDIQCARGNRAHIRDVVPCRGDGLAVARAVHAADDVIARIDDLIVVRIFARELRRIGNILCCYIRTAVGNILVRIGGSRGVRRLSACARDQVQPDNLVPVLDVPITVRMFRHPVVDLRDLLRLRLDLGRGNRPLRRHCVGICCVYIFKIALRCVGRTEEIVREGAGRPVLRSRDDIVCDMVRLRLVRGTVCTRRITGKMPVLTGHREIDIVLVLIDDPRIGAACCRLCDKGLAVLQGKGTRTVIDLCRIGDRAVVFTHLKARFLDQTTVDRALAVDGIVDLVVVLLRCVDDRLKQLVDILITDIMLIAVARVRILGKGTSCDASIGTLCRSRRHHLLVLLLQLCLRDTVVT